MKKKLESFLVCADFSNDIPVLVVGTKVKNGINIINAFKGEEAAIKGDDYDYLVEGFAAGMGISCDRMEDDELLDKLCPNLDGPVPVSMTLPGDFDGDELV